jgi:hypothetical protein
LLDLITPDGAVSFLVNNLTLVPATADYRIMTLQYSMETLRENLLFGVGHSGDVDLPWWHTGSIDNYWLSTAVNHGLPATLLLIALIVVHLWRVMMATGLDATAGAYRSGHLIAVTGLIFTLTTVHIWGAASVMVMAYLGAGVWIYAPRPDEAARRLRRRAPAPLARAKQAGAPGPPPPAPPLPTRVPHAPAAGGAPRPRGSTGRYGGRR